MKALTVSGQVLAFGLIISGSVFLGDLTLSTLPLLFVGLGLTAVAVMLTQE